MDNLKPQINVGFLTVWFGTAYVCLLFALTLLLYLSIAKNVIPVSQSFKLYASLPDSGMAVSDEVQMMDARAKIIDNFLKNYGSPLANYGEVFVKVADQYNLDYRLLPSIAMQESLGGKKVINNSYNPFGYGIYGSSVVKFTSWEEAIERVGRALREDYLNLGLKTPNQIMTKYTPPSLAKGGAWAKGVSSFMSELE